jgi:predicted membrane metal-binding protein
MFYCFTLHSFFNLNRAKLQTCTVLSRLMLQKSFNSWLGLCSTTSLVLLWLLHGGGQNDDYQAND